jgi:alcohol dehydrogenase class IV
LNEKISNNNKYLNKLSKVSSKASENTNSIVEKNKQLFSQAGIAKNIKELNIGKQPHSTTTFKQIVNSSAPASSNVQPLSFTTSITPSYFSQNKQ